MNRIQNEYLEWIYNLIYDEYSSKSYKKLLYYLYDQEFTYTLEMDGNRAQYGIDFRYRFGHEHGYSEEIIREYLDIKPCSILEMMIALAFYVEDEIMEDDAYGNRISQWFWAMIASLKLGKMDDTNFNDDYVEERLSIFLNRRYSANGMGGLFTVENSKRDMRTVDIWTQCMWYLNYIIES